MIFNNVFRFGAVLRGMFRFAAGLWLRRVAPLRAGRLFGYGLGGVVAAAGVSAAVRTLFLPLALALLAAGASMTAVAQSQTEDGGVSNAMLAERLDSVNDSLNDSLNREVGSVHREIASVRRENDIRREETHAKIDSLAVNMDTRFESLMNQMNTRFESLMNQMNTRFESLESKMTWLGWAVGLIIAMVAVFYTDMRRQNAEFRQQNADMQRQIIDMQKRSDAKFDAMQRQIDAMLRQMLPQAEVVEMPSAGRQVEPRGAVDATDAPARARA